MITGVSTIFIFVHDLKRSVRFYRDVMGIPIAREGEQDARFQVGGFNVVVHEDLSRDEFVKWKINPEPGERGWGSILTLQSDDVDAEYERLKPHEPDFICKPTSMPWGTRMFLVRDPDGYILEVSKPLEGESPDH
jgi:catechol 2,3-dioxygenase-like lactoylglutathione lyase family enzyme